MAKPSAIVTDRDAGPGDGVVAAPRARLGQPSPSLTWTTRATRPAAGGGKPGEGRPCGSGGRGQPRRRGPPPLQAERPCDAGEEGGGAPGVADPLATGPGACSRPERIAYRQCCDGAPGGGAVRQHRPASMPLFITASTQQAGGPMEVSFVVTFPSDAARIAHAHMPADTNRPPAHVLGLAVAALRQKLAETSLASAGVPEPPPSRGPSAGGGGLCQGFRGCGLSILRIEGFLNSTL